MTTRMDLTNVLRQIKDVQLKADKILKGETNAGHLEDFANYSSELKSFLLKNFTDQDLILLANAIQEVNFERAKLKIWHLALFGLPVYWLQQRAKAKTINEIGQARSQWATLEFELKLRS